MMLSRIAFIIATLFISSVQASADHYWLGRKADAKTDEYVFDVLVPDDLAAGLACSIPAYAKALDGVREFEWEANGKKYTFLENPIGWDGNKIETGTFAYVRNNGIGQLGWARFSTQGEAWKACKEALLASKENSRFGKDWSEAKPIMLRTKSTENPKLKINFNTADAPYNINRDVGTYDSTIAGTAPTKKPQIVPVVQNGVLYIAWQAWDRTHPSGKVFVDKLVQDKLVEVRQIESGGTLVGFTVDSKGIDYVLTAKEEEFENTPSGDFVSAIAKTWRSNVMVLHTKGVKTNLNTEKFSNETMYGICNAGSGRLASSKTELASVFARRHYSSGDGKIHQEADSLLTSLDLSSVPMKADNHVSHSFDQRLIYDGKDFVALHQADMFPFTGLIIEKIRATFGTQPTAVRKLAYTCPTLDNQVFFELGGLTSEKDGYPVLFTTTHNTDTITAENARAKEDEPWDLGLVFVLRDFDLKPASKNPYDIVGSGILAKGIARPESLRYDNKASSGRLESRSATRQVDWLTTYGSDKGAVKKASSPKLVPLGKGKYIVLYEELMFTGKQWKFEQTWAMTVTIEGNAGIKQIKTGQLVSLKNLRLHRCDDAVELTVNGVPQAAWVTAGETNKQLLLHTIDGDLKYKAQTLTLP